MLWSRLANVAPHARTGKSGTIAAWIAAWRATHSAHIYDRSCLPAGFAGLLCWLALLACFAGLLCWLAGLLARLPPPLENHTMTTFLTTVSDILMSSWKLFLKCAPMPTRTSRRGHVPRFLHMTPCMTLPRK